MDEECMRCCLKENDTSKMERRNDREVYGIVDSHALSVVALFSRTEIPQESCSLRISWFPHHSTKFQDLLIGGINSNHQNGINQTLTSEPAQRPISKIPAAVSTHYREA
ncbi:Deoxyguanosinetriphosphate triphosphohydrolase-like protein [Trichinella pseudospiralis]